MKVIVVKNYDELSELGASIIAKLIKEKPNCTLGLATGSSPVGTYQNLIKAYQNGEISFKDVHSYNLDEYCGIDRNHPQSYYYFMHDNLFNHVDIVEENTHVPYAAPGSDLDAEAKKYTEALNSVEIDLQLLGIGGNGHIGFNEPNDEFDKLTHCVDLPERTIEANKRFCATADDVPKQAYTMGIGTIMKAKKILVVVSGADKAQIVKDAFFGPVTPRVPASILQFHPDVTVVADEAALSLVK